MSVGQNDLTTHVPGYQDSNANGAGNLIKPVIEIIITKIL